ncbi:MAG: DUF4430 domain-containing protein [Bacillota bacterium]|nr:DUF4430 domain-containing protein [Bacillota bacterium]
MRRYFKIFTILFVFVLLLSLFGCSNDSLKEKSKASPPVKTGKVVKTSAPEKTVQKNESETASSKQVNPPKTSVNKTIPTQPKKQITPITKQTGTVVVKKTQATQAPKTTVKTNPVPSKTVTFSIMGPKDKGVILSSTKVSIKDGDTILDVLIHATQSHSPKIQVDYSGSGATAYVEGIDNIYEFDYGAKSGWLFKQNGVGLTKGAGISKIKAGDWIECYYTQ